MKITSLVPSWTETLVECGLQVVGRTRFCIHPGDKVKDIPIVGGTKDVRWESLTSLKADLLLLDQEENPKRLAQQSPIPWFATHVTGISVLPFELQALSKRLESQTLESLSQRWQVILNNPPPSLRMRELPGVLRWVNRPKTEAKKFAYIVWRDPWMAVSKDTFIGSIFEHFGFENVYRGEKYPKVGLHELPPDTVLLFSSEPYPFSMRGLPDDLPNPMAIVDGEKYGWFGLRSLIFLESLKNA